ncbi:MAG: hypothetical protein WC348_03160 [Patescibacteria group bacterium]|jgi:hypothetical protein
MSEQRDREEPQVESQLMTEGKVIQKMHEVTGRSDLEICSETVLHGKQGEVKSLGTKTIWNKTPDENGIYHGFAFWYEPAEGKENRRWFKEFNNMIFRVDWTGVKKGETIEEDEEEGQEVIADW